ncbi:MAG: extracellular solute-binding protein [Gordonia sp. (in: high G+C Gram-positive bacteria)]
MLAACSSSYEPGVINLYTPSGDIDAFTASAATCTEKSGGAYRIHASALPKNADDQRLQLARRLAGNDHGLDLMAMDVVWTAEFADANWIVPVPDDIAAQVTETNLGGPIETTEWKRPADSEKRMFALPANTNTQLLWFRPDLMKSKLGSPKAPVTWDKVVADAVKIKDKGGPGQIVLQAKQYEGLTVWFNSLLASAGGAILDPNDPTKVTLNDTPQHRAATLAALKTMKAVATAPGHDPSITNSDEGTAQLAMEAGDAAFEINWPFVFGSARTNGSTGDAKFLGGALTQYKDVVANTTDLTDPALVPVNKALRKRFDFAAYPAVIAGKPAKSTLGGLNIAVASTSKQKDLAFQAAQCLTGKDSQLIYALQAGTPPTIAALYDNPDFQAAYPMWEAIAEQLKTGRAAPRPASPQYQEISIAIYSGLSPVGDWDPEKLVDVLADKVGKAVKGEGLVP